MEKNKKLSPTNKELVEFYMGYITEHSYFKIRTLVKLYMKNHPRIVNAKIRETKKRSLGHRFTILNRKLLALNIIEKYNKATYKTIGDLYILSKLSLKKN